MHYQILRSIDCGVLIKNCTQCSFQATVERGGGGGGGGGENSKDKLTNSEIF